ncbi:conserved Plasmodium protein, unknown function [Plasmodium berghei]|uniref:Uncharacterized protein n=2 Tax=Plasmodium berghei TaxID=5821 RepID=A0A509AJ67_PLABA|nr:conserved Plasmodium protein, unknown function [Plasmodium berghei ANKA]CXI46636.1 conserved Plasmodium protein, unknown function [Plasmodium berghei]SCM22807.1 conserved Plasmodium protein, unknown function [Plasmodium berghei]SCN25705.1 conserved Plasmodium protein, unknown function [Plasmodium berghei]SCO60624.1 conserved Plasmodium protein, unknown function [Plasmodium berghei]SCO62351.1 conserved Plasmodium protein, unknown function [Plasmodium berghei]|eukprot:XP_034421768.1 conserved Plasmodium protein, unknown function [Plasmodium berghei ANKA]
MMKKLINISVFIAAFLPNFIYSFGDNNKLANVVFDNNTNKNDNKDFQYIYIDKNYYAPDIVSSEIKNINIDDEIYFYKSYTNIISYFKYQPPVNIKFHFKYNGGDLIILKNNKKGIICKISDIFYSETGLNIFMRSKSSNQNKSIKYQQFSVKLLPDWGNGNYSEHDNKNSDLIDEEYEEDDDLDDDDNDHTNRPAERGAICEIENDKFLSHKLLCFPSIYNNNQIKMSFLKNLEFNRLSELGNKFIINSNYALLEKIITHLKNVSNINLDIKNISYYVYMKTINCNLKKALLISMGLENSKENGNDKNNKYSIHTISNIFGIGNNQIDKNLLGKSIYDYTDEEIEQHNKFLTNEQPYNGHENNNFIIWKHTNEHIIKGNYEECNRVLISEGEFYNCFGNLENAYEIKVSKENIIDKLKKNKIKYISSINKYTAYYYDKINYLVILKDYKLYLFFKLDNVLDFVLFTDIINHINFYYISNNNNNDKILNVYRCLVHSLVKCECISTIPNENRNNGYENNIYLSTSQNRDSRAVYVSTKNKIWSIKVDDFARYEHSNKYVYVRKVIDSIENPDKGYFGNINCYTIIVRQYESFLAQFFNLKRRNKETVGCSYLKHFNDHENILLVSFAENINFIQRTYHIVRNKNYVLSTGDITLDIKINGLNDILYIIAFFVCIIIIICNILRHLFPDKSKIHKLEHEFFSNSKNSCPSTVGE